MIVFTNLFGKLQGVMKVALCPHKKVSLEQLVCSLNRRMYREANKPQSTVKDKLVKHPSQDSAAFILTCRIVGFVGAGRDRGIGRHSPPKFGDGQRGEMLLVGVLQ